MRPREGKSGARPAPAGLLYLPSGDHSAELAEGTMSGQFGFGAAGSSPPQMRSEIPDLVVYGEGTLYLLHASSPRGAAWIAAHIPPDAQRLGTAVAVEHRYIADIVRGAVADGLRVR